MFSVFNRGWLAALGLLPALTALATPLTPEKTPDAAVVVAVFAEASGMQAMADEDMSDVQAQAGSLILMDRIGPNELTGATSPGTYANFTYYRMGLDAKLDLNANISKLQLGCGGVNDFLTGARGCDLDIDYVGFMGINAAGDRPGAAGSPFQLKRPFIEVAVKNANDPIKREVVGFRLGAQNINGAIRMGRDYTNFGYPDYTNANTNIPNLENGDTCNPSATTGPGVVGCHSGLNSISGYLAGLELSAGFLARARVCIDITTICPFGLGVVTLDIDGCLGRIAFNPCNTNDTPFFIDAGGTRLTSLNVAAAQLRLSTNFILPIQLEGYGRLNLDTRQIHYLLTPNSPGFFLSFQRERVSWPNYEKAPPPNNLAFDSCNPTYGQVTARCSSAYSPTANTGWWLSANNTKMLNLRPSDRIVLPGTLNVYTLLSALGPDSSNIVIDNPKLDFIAADNCYGTARFC